MNPWRYRLTDPYTHRSPHLAGVSFSNRWLTIEGGAIRIEAGYAWDGCSPSWPIFGGALWLGPWDGPLGIDGRPAGFHATMVHDALCQFAPAIQIERSSTVALFAEMLAAGGMPRFLQRLYVAAVFIFGPRRWQPTQSPVGGNYQE